MVYSYLISHIIDLYIDINLNPTQKRERERFTKSAYKQSCEEEEEILKMNEKK